MDILSTRKIKRKKGNKTQSEKKMNINNGVAGHRQLSGANNRKIC